MGNSTVLWGHNGSGFAITKGVWGHDGSSFKPAKFVFGKSAGGSWIPRYSVLSASASGGSHTDSGASSSGTASVVAGVNTVSGSYATVSYVWTRLSGSQISCSANIATPTWSCPFTGVANGTTSGTVSESFRVTITDDNTGATTTADITINLAWQNTIPAFSGQTDPFYGPASGTINPPAGANTVRIYIVGGGGDGGSGNFIDTESMYGGGGGASGARAVWFGSAQSFTYSAGGPRTGSSVSGIASASAGGNGSSAFGTNVGHGNPGGNTASGGNESNDPGNGGGSGAGGNDGSGGGGGAGQSTPLGDFGAGGNGGSSGSSGDDGQQGAIVFVWYP